MKSNKNSSSIAEEFAILPELKISEQECELAKQYLNGVVGDEALDQFQRINYKSIAVSSEVCYELDRTIGRLDRK